MPNTGKVIFAWNEKNRIIAISSYYCKHLMYNKDHIIDMYVLTTGLVMPFDTKRLPAVTLIISVLIIYKIREVNVKRYKSEKVLLVANL